MAQSSSCIPSDRQTFDSPSSIMWPFRVVIAEKKSAAHCISLSFFKSDITKSRDNVMLAMKTNFNCYTKLWIGKGIACSSYLLFYLPFILQYVKNMVLGELFWVKAQARAGSPKSYSTDFSIMVAKNLLQKSSIISQMCMANVGVEKNSFPFFCENPAFCMLLRKLVFLHKKKFDYW